MDAQPQGDLHPSTQGDLPHSTLIESALSRRGFLRGATLTGGGLIAAGIAACTPTSAVPDLPVRSRRSPAAPRARPERRRGAAASAGRGDHVMPSAGASAAPPASGARSGPGPGRLDRARRRRPDRRSGATSATSPRRSRTSTATRRSPSSPRSSAPPTTTRSSSSKPAFAQVPQLVLNDALTPLTPELDGGVKVFKLTIDEIDQQIDELKPPVAGARLQQAVARADDPRDPGRQGPGDLHEQPEGDDRRPLPRRRVRRLLPGRRPVRDPAADRARARRTPTSSPPTNAGSLMYHSHHNATDQVGRGLLGAFIVDPKPNPVKVDRDYIWISNDSLGGFTINGHGFPADRAGARRGRRDGPDPVHERGDHDASVAPPRVPHEGHRARRLAARERRVRVRHARRQPGRALRRPHHRRPARHLGVPLPHPAPRRGARRACSGWSTR